MTATRAVSCAGAEGGERAAKVGALPSSGGSVHRAARAGLALGLFLVTACRALLDYEPAPARVEDGGSGGGALGGAAPLGGGGGAGPGGATGNEPLDAAMESHGHEDASVTVPADGGLQPPPDNPLCTDYCATVQRECTDTNTMYVPGSAECAALCPHFVRSPEQEGNTLACRMNQARLAMAASEDEEEYCNAASRMGEFANDGACGSACEAYCQLMSSVCPAEFAEIFANTECVSECALLHDNGNFHAGTCEEGGDANDGATVQCRMWHIGAAAIALSSDRSRYGAHCAHASGADPCDAERITTSPCAPERAVPPLVPRP